MRKFFENVEDYEFRIDLFSRLTGLWILINFISQLPLYQSLWGGVENLIVSREVYGRKLPVFLDLLTHYTSLAPFIFLITIIGSVFLVLGKSYLILRILLWYTVWLLDAQAWTVQDGGNNLIHLTLFYSILFDLRTKKNSSQNFIPKMGVRAIQVQVLIIYFCAFFSKVSGQLWQNGTALHYIIQIDKFHSRLLINLFQTFPLFVPILSYFTILSQLILLTLLPIKRWRILAISLGIAIHMGIALHIGLIMFSLVMMVHYSIFITKEDLHFAESFVKKNQVRIKYVSIVALFTAVFFAGIFFLNTSRSNYFTQETLLFVTQNLQEGSQVLVFNSNNEAEMISKSGKKIISTEKFIQMQLEYGSITKLVTALEFISLEKLGLISRGEKIKLNNGRSVALNELLFHQSGILDIEQKALSLTVPDEKLYEVSANKDFKYSNANYALAGQYIQKIKRPPLNYDVDQSKDYSMININKRPKITDFFKSAFGIVGTAKELKLIMQKVELKNLPCSQGRCWGGFMKNGRFITVGKIASGTTLGAIDSGGNITILSSNDYKIDLIKILEMMK